MTGKVIWHMTMSLDGFIASPDDTMDWVFEAAVKPSQLADEVIRTTGAFMQSGRLISEFGKGRERPYGGRWSGPIFILTHKDPATRPDPSLIYVSGDIRDAVATALEAANGKNLVVTGAAVPRLCIDAGLVDEIVLHIIPILLGEGVRFYDNPGAPHTKLNVLTEEGLNLRFEVVK